MNKKGNIFLPLTIIFASVSFIAIAAAGYLYFQTKSTPSSSKTITWEQCVKTPGSTMQTTYPGKCFTPDGRSVLQPISDEEKNTTIPPNVDTSNWTEHEITTEPILKLQDYKIKIPAPWKRVEHSSNFQRMEIFKDSLSNPTYTLTINELENINPSTNNAYPSIKSFYGFPYELNTKKVDNQEALQGLPRAGSESNFQVAFFSTGKTQIITIQLDTPIDGSRIKEGQQLFDQILSTFNLLSTPTPINPNAIIYTSTKFGITFSYQKNVGAEETKIKETENKIYIYSSIDKDYTQGQWLEVFSKEASQSLTNAIKSAILPNVSASDCQVTTPGKIVSPSYYPASYQTAMITVPTRKDDDLSTLGPKWAKCHEPYVTENGISYFLMDSNHPEKFIYLSIGQYPIMSGVPNQTWQDTIKFL